MLHSLVYFPKRIRAVFSNQEIREILLLINSKGGRELLGIKHSFPIIRFDSEWIEWWEGEINPEGKPILYATVWVHGSNFVERQIFTPYTKLKNADEEYKPIEKPIDFYKGFLHYSNLELYPKKFPQIFLLDITKNPDTAEIYLEDTDNTWATVRADSDAASNGSSMNCTSNFASPTYRIRRGFLPFNTSTIGELTVSAATFEFYRDDAISVFQNGDTTSFELVTGTWTGNSIASTDFDSFTFSSRGTKTFASTTNGAYNTITITVFTGISGTAYTQYVTITGRDLGNSAPTGLNELFYRNRASASPAKLNLTYTLNPIAELSLNINQAVNRSNTF